MAINLSDTTPVAPANRQNVTWQTDVSGNVSASSSDIAVKTSIGSSAGVLTVDASLGNSFIVTLTENVTSMSITNPVNGQELTLLWSQDSTGGWTVSFATNLKGATVPSNTANSFSCQKFTYDSTAGNWYAVASGVTGM